MAPPIQTVTPVSPPAQLVAFLRVAAARHDPHRQLGDDRAVADHPVDDHTGPAVIKGELRQPVSKQRATARSPAVDHQHTPFTGLFELLAHAAVVVQAFDGLYRSAKGAHPSEVPQAGVEYP